MSTQNQPAKKHKPDARKMELVRQGTKNALVKRGLEDLAKLPILECLIPQGLFATGLGTIIVSRKISEDEIVVAGFLLDVFCLGVKKAFLRVLKTYEYQHTIESSHQHENFGWASPPLAKTLIEQCVEYAKDLGFKPHSEYEAAHYIFGGVDAAECSEVFTFGFQGKPYFVAGPNDAPGRCQRIVETLASKCGPDGYNYRPRKGGS